MKYWAEDGKRKLYIYFCYYSIIFSWKWKNNNKKNKKNSFKVDKKNNEYIESQNFIYIFFGKWVLFLILKSFESIENNWKKLKLQTN